VTAVATDFRSSGAAASALNEKPPVAGRFSWVRKTFQSSLLRRHVHLRRQRLILDRLVLMTL
jgi:hypothetical protein